MIAKTSWDASLEKRFASCPLCGLEVGKFIHSPFSRAACPIGLCRIVAAATAVHSGVKGRTLSVGRSGGSIGRRVVHCSISAAFQWNLMNHLGHVCVRARFSSLLRSREKESETQTIRKKLRLLLHEWEATSSSSLARQVGGETAAAA